MACHAHTFDPQVRLVLVLCLHLWWVSTSATGKKERKKGSHVYFSYLHISIWRPNPLGWLLSKEIAPWQSLPSHQVCQQQALMWQPPSVLGVTISMYEKCYPRTQELHTYAHHDHSMKVMINDHKQSHLHIP